MCLHSLPQFPAPPHSLTPHSLTPPSPQYFPRELLEEDIVSYLVGALSPVNQKDYISAEGDFHKELYSWKDQQGRIKIGRTEWESGDLLGEFIERNTVENTIKTETDTRTE